MKYIAITITLFFCTYGIKGFAYDIAVKNDDGVTIYYNYSYNRSQLAVTNQGIGTIDYSGNIVIPEMVNFNDEIYPVTSINKQAFSGCVNLTSVTIPESVTFMGPYAFDGCKSLTSITIPNSLTQINRYVFQNCTSLTSIEISNSVTTIEEGAFDGCTGLKDITIPNSVVSIGEKSFQNCCGLSSIIIPNSVKYIGSSLEGYINPFLGCVSLTSVVVEDGNTEYDSREGCNAIIKSSNQQLITGCINTKIPNSVKSIGSCAFYDCRNLSTITIPNSVTSIGSSAFAGCTNLSTITIPNSVTSIGSSAFSGCSSLTSVNLSDNLASIGERAFENCNGLSSLTIPKNVNSIGYKAFNGINLITIISLIESPYSIYGKSESIRTFSTFTFNNSILYVPAGSKDKYSTTKGWTDFINIKEIGVEPTEKCATPIISYKDGELSFSCETEGVEYCYSVTTPSSLVSTGEKVKLTTKYTVSVYAKKDGYENSDTATMEIDIQGIMGDANGDGTVTVTDIGVIVDIILGKNNQNARKFENTMEPQ